MSNEIENTDQPNPDEVLAAIQSFNDPSIITNMFRELGWSYSIEIRETLIMAKQNANLSIKFKAIKHLRELLREAAEAAGYVANVSVTSPNVQGGHTTFSAKRIAGILNPVKKIKSTEIKELPDDNKKIESNRGCNRRESKRPEGTGKIHEGISDGTDTAEQFPPERDSGRAESERDAEFGGTESSNGGETSGRAGGGTSDGCDTDAEASNPCIETRPPTGDQSLFPGVSTSAGD